MSETAGKRDIARAILEDFNFQIMAASEQKDQKRALCFDEAKKIVMYHTKTHYLNGRLLDKLDSYYPLDKMGVPIVPKEIKVSTKQ